MKNMVETPKKLNAKEQAKQAAKEHLRSILKPGDEVYTILRHVSRSGMMRHISVVVKLENGITDITHWVAQLLDDRRADDGGIKIGGCGMDMGFALVYDLGSVLFRDEFQCIGEGCPANDHANPPYPKRKTGGMLHTDAGYAFRQRWL